LAVRAATVDGRVRPGVRHANIDTILPWLGAVGAAELGSGAGRVCNLWRIDGRDLAGHLVIPCNPSPAIGFRLQSPSVLVGFDNRIQTRYAHAKAAIIIGF